MQVRVGCIPGKLIAKDIEEGTTMDQLLESSGYVLDDYELRVNGELCEADHPVADGDIVMLLKKISGN